MSLSWLKFVLQPYNLETGLLQLPEEVNCSRFKTSVFICSGKEHSCDQKANAPVRLFLVVHIPCPLFEKFVPHEWHLPRYCQRAYFPNPLEAKVKSCNLDFSNKTHSREILTQHMQNLMIFKIMAFKGVFKTEKYLLSSINSDTGI